MRCEGWRRHGGFMTFGPIEWKQCTNKAIVMLTVKQDGKTQSLPGCNICWREAIEAPGITIVDAKPLLTREAAAKENGDG